MKGRATKDFLTVQKHHIDYIFIKLLYKTIKTTVYIHLKRAQKGVELYFVEIRLCFLIADSEICPDVSFIRRLIKCMTLLTSAVRGNFSSFAMDSERPAFPTQLQFQSVFQSSIVVNIC